MITLPACKIKESGGRLGIDTSEYGTELQQYLRSALDKKVTRVSVTLKRPSRPKSEGQRNAYWALLDVAQATDVMGIEARNKYELHQKFSLQHAAMIVNYWILVADQKILAVRQPNDSRPTPPHGHWVAIPKGMSEEHGGWTMDDTRLMLDLVIASMEQGGILQRNDQWSAKYHEIITGMESE